MPTIYPYGTDSVLIRIPGYRACQGLPGQGGHFVRYDQTGDGEALCAECRGREADQK